MWVSVRGLIILLVGVKTISASQPCQTPNGRTGDCIPMSDCEDAKNEFPEHVRKSYCDFEKTDPKMCCRSNLPISRRSTAPFIQSDLLPDEDTCGIQSENKIIGGTVTDLEEHPWMARLEYEDRYTGFEWSECGGVLINERYVLTAAHCMRPELVSVTLGEWNISSTVDRIGNTVAPPPVKIPIENRLIFNSYDPKDYELYHDIALLRLKTKVKYTEYIRPICLPTATKEIFEYYLGKNVTVVGWGRTEKGIPSSVKLKVTLPVNRCHNEFLDPGQICAGGLKNKGSCKGDSGGPLMIEHLNEDYNVNWYLLGLLSNGPKVCGQQSKSAVYTKVVKYMYWIVNNLEP